MKIKISEILSRVYALLNENPEVLEERVEYGEPTAMLKPLILDLLPDAARCVLLNANIDHVDDCIKMSDPVLEEGHMQKIVRLPEDYLRIVSVRMSDWPYAVRVPLQQDSQELSIRSRQEFLKCRRHCGPAFTVRRTGPDVLLEIFGSSPDASIIEICYVPVPKITGKYINLPPALIHEVCAKTAEMVLAVTSR